MYAKGASVSVRYRRHSSTHDKNNLLECTGIDLRLKCEYASSKSVRCKVEPVIPALRLVTYSQVATRIKVSNQVSNRAGAVDVPLDGETS